MEKIIKIFLGSPGDLVSERNQAKEIVDRVNRDAGRNLKYYFDLFRWEDRQPSSGRPQTSINEDVDKCDIFVGLVWKKWGSSPSGSEYTSGFQEELERVKDRVKRGEKVHIALFFKEISQTDLKNPGEELKKVITFKEEIKKEFLYKEFTEHDWESTFYSFLVDYVTKEVVKMPPAMAQEKSSPVIAPQTPTKISEQPERPELLQAKSMVKDLLETISDADKLNELPIVKKARLYLLTSSILYRNNFYKILDNHEVQLIYSKRNELNLIPIERELIFRTLLADKYNLKAGWYWFKDMSKKQLLIFIRYFAIKDPDEDVRKGSLILLEKIWSKNSEQFVIKCLQDNSIDIRKEAIEILEKRGSSKCVNYLEPLISDKNPDIQRNAWKSKFAILSRTNIYNAWEFFLQSRRDGIENIETYLEAIISQLPSKELKKFQQDKNKNLQILIYKELLKRNDLDMEAIKMLTKSPDSEIRYKSYCKLLENGEDINTEEVRDNWPSSQYISSSTKDFCEELIVKIFQKYQKEKLLELVDWVSLNGSIAYFVLGSNYFNFSKDFLRRDLKEHFKRIKQESLNKYKQVRVSTLKEIAQLDEFIVSKYAEKALKVLLEHGNEEDLPLAKEYINNKSPNVQKEVIEILIKFGTYDDALELSRIAFLSVYSEIKERSAEGAILLDKENKFDIVNKFLDSNDPILVRVALKSKLENNEKVSLEIINKLLLNENENIRVAVLSYLIRIFSKRQITIFLKRYHNHRYFYNVVSWIDKYLYAPEPLNKTFKEELISKLNQTSSKEYDELE